MSWHAGHVGVGDVDVVVAELVAEVNVSRELGACHVVAGEVIVAIGYRRDNAVVSLLDWVAEQDCPADAMPGGKELIRETDRDLKKWRVHNRIAIEVIQILGRVMRSFLRRDDKEARVLRGEHLIAELVCNLDLTSDQRLGAGLVKGHVIIGILDRRNHSVVKLLGRVAKAEDAADDRSVLEELVFEKHGRRLDLSCLIRKVALEVIDLELLLGDGGRAANEESRRKGQNLFHLFSSPNVFARSNPGGPPGFGFSRFY